MAAYLTLGYRSDPRDCKIDYKSHNAYNPNRFSVLSSIISEDDREDDATKVSNTTSKTRDNTCSSD